MLKNLISYGRQNLSGLDHKKLIKSLNQSEITNAKHCDAFEKKISSIAGSKYALACNNGTSALLMSILSLNKKNIFAIIPNINFVAIASILNLIKGKYILCDIDYKTGMIDGKSFKEVIEFCKKKKLKPNIVFPVHYAGSIADLKIIKNLAKKNKITVIEDGCHSFGSIDNKKNPIGSCKNSLLTTFSFHPVKNITTIEGGAITTNSKKIYQKLKLIRNHNLKKTSFDDPYTLQSPSLNFRLGEVNSVIGLDQIAKVNNFKKKRQELVNYYIHKLKKFEKFFEIYNFKSNNIFWHLFVILLKKDLKKKKKSFMIFLNKKNINTQIHYKPLSSHKILFDNAEKVFNKNSKKFYNSQLTLPLHTRMNFADIDYIEKNIYNFIQNYILTK